MQLSFDAADRLVELVEARRGPVPVDEAAGPLRARLGADGDCTIAARRRRHGRCAARLARHVGRRSPTRPGRDRTRDSVIRRLRSRDDRAVARPLTHRRDRAQRVEALEVGATFETLVNPGVRCRWRSRRSPGSARTRSRRAPGADLAVRRFLSFADDAVLVAHNARFDMGFLDRAVERLTGRRVAAPVVDTVWLARRLLSGRTKRFGLAPLAHFFGTNVGSMPSRTRRRFGNRRDPDRVDRACAGTRSGDGCRPRRAVGASCPPSPRQARARRRRADVPGDVHLP